MEENLKTLTLANSVSSKSFSTLLSSLNKLEQQLANNSDNASNELPKNIVECSRSLAEVEGRTGSSSLQIGQSQKRELESWGGKLWNRSSTMEIAIVRDENVERALPVRKVVAKLRHLALRVIKLVVTPTSDTAKTILLLDLTTQTALAYLASNKVKQSRELETEAAQLADSLKDVSRIDNALRSKSASTVLAFLVFRMRLSLATGAVAIAEWMRKKADDLMREEEISSQQIILVARIAYELGIELAARENDLDDGIGWLEWAKGVLKDEPGSSARALKLAILKKLVFICSKGSTEKSKNNVEEALKELIHIEPTFLRKRKLLELVLARKGSDQDVINIFKDLTTDVASEEHRSSITSDLYRIPEDRHNLRFDIARALFDKISGATAAITNDPTAEVALLLDQILCIVALHLKSEDLDRTTELLNFIEHASPSYRISSESAYLIAIYLQTVAKAVETQHPEESINWYSLMLIAPLQQLDSGLLAHTARTLALRYIESNELERADEVLRRCPNEGEDARTDIVRSHLAALQDDTLRAVETFSIACSAANFSTDLLVWVAHQANESGRREFFSLILVKIVEAAKEGKEFEGVDLMVAGRLLVRMTMDKVRASLELPENDLIPPLLSSLEGALEIARSVAEETKEVPADFAKSLAWIRLATLELCDSFSTLWSCASFAKLYDVIASIAQVEISQSEDTEDLLSIYGKCRLASLAAQAMEVRISPSQDQVEGFKTLLQNVGEFHDELTSNGDPYPQQLAKEDFLKLLKSAILLQAEAHAALDQYEGLLRLVELFEDDELGFDDATSSTLRMIAAKAPSSPSCPYEILCSIYRKILTILYRNHSLKPLEMAVWLRLIISILLPKDSDEAFEYLQNAQQLAVEHTTSYPPEEVSWLINTAWDKGIDLYSSASPVSGSKWCQLSISISQSTEDEGRTQQLEEWFEGLKEQYNDEEDGEEEMQE